MAVVFAGGMGSVVTGLVGGRYEVVGELGSGSMGVVWRAVDTVLDREVALKELRPPAGLEPEEAVERFLTEARAAAGLSHRSIVTIHDVFAEADRVLMSMELLEGPTLAEVLTNGGLGDAARSVMTDVAGALATAHHRGVVHRDLKPENIFLLDSGRVVVCDFGLARIGAGRGTQVGTVMGTPGYMAPEQLKGCEVGPHADVFAWGAVAYELASGIPAFGDAATEDFVALSYRVAHVDPAPLSIEGDTLFGEVISAALMKDPEERLANGEALLNALSGGAVSTPAGSGMSSVPPRSVGSLPPAVPKRWRALSVGAGAVVLIVSITLIVVLASGGEPQQAAETEPGITARPAPEASGAAPPTTTRTPTTPSVAPTIGATGRPIYRGFVVVLSSNFKEKPNTVGEVEAAARSVAGAFVIDTDDYITGDGTPPNYHPRAGVLAAGVGPFRSADDARTYCAANRSGQPCNERQLVPR